MKSVLDELKEMQAELDSLNEKRERLLSEQSEVDAKIQAAEQAIGLATRVAAYYENQIKETAELYNESFQTLYIKHKSGGITDADFKQYADDVGHSIEVESAPDEEETEAA